MYIESIDIQSFGALEGFVFSPGPGVNIVEGANESGKSTVCAFIKFMLYGMSGRPAEGEVMSERRRRMNYSGAHAGGGMIVVCGGKRLRIERSVAVSASGAKETARESVSVTDLESGDKIPLQGSVGEALLGVPEGVFTDTAYFRQLFDTGIDGNRMSEAIANILFSGDETVDAQKAAERLDAARRQLLHRNEKGGIIYELRNETEGLKLALEEAMRSNTEIMAKEGAVTERGRSLEEKEGRLSYLKKKIEACETARALHRIDELRSAEGKAAEALKRAEELKSTRYIASREFTDRLRAELASAQSLTREGNMKEEARDELAREAEQYADVEETGKKTGDAGTAELYARHEGLRAKKKTRIISGVALTALSCAAAVLGFLNIISFLSPLRLYAASGLCALLAAAFFAGAARAGKKARGIRAVFEEGMRPGQLSDYIRSYENRKGMRDGCMARLKGAEDDLERISDRLHAVLETLSLLLTQAGETPDKNPTPDLLAFITRLEEDRREYEGALSEANNQSRIAASLKTEVGEADEKALRARLEELDVPEADKADLAAARRERDFYEQQTALLREKIHEIEKRLVELRATRESPVELNGRLNEAQEKLLAETKRLEAYKTAIDAISRASANLRSGIAPRLALYACGAIDVMTGGKYGRMHIDSGLELTYDADGAARSLEYLSAGTRDAAYTGLRFALIDLLYKKEKPPVILDESLAHQDSSRTAGVFKMLKKLSEEGVQSLVFTCREREGEVAKRTLSEDGFTHIKFADRKSRIAN